MPSMSTSARRIDYTWLILIGLTLGGVALGVEAAGPSLWLTLVIAAITALKGRLVIDQFMELGNANPHIRRLVRLWGLLVPALILLVWVWGPQIARMSQL